MRQSNILKRNCLCVAKQISIPLSRDPRVCNNSRCHVICRKQSKASLHVKKKKYSSSTEKSQASHRLMQAFTDCFLSFSFCQLCHGRSTSKHFQMVQLATSAGTTATYTYKTKLNLIFTGSQSIRAIY